MLLHPQCVVDDEGNPTDTLSPEVLDFCRKLNVRTTKVSEVIANKEPALYKVIQEGINQFNKRSTSNAQKIQKWILLEKDFSVNGGELGQKILLFFYLFSFVFEKIFNF